MSSVNEPNAEGTEMAKRDQLTDRVADGMPSLAQTEATKISIPPTAFLVIVSVLTFLVQALQVTNEIHS